MPSLVVDLFEAGLLQFGWFEGAPLRLSLELLPSYPDLLRRIAAEAASSMEMAAYDHLICVPEALPLGIALSLHTGIPTVYSRGSDQPGMIDLIGAYDVGHPALLLVNTWWNSAPFQGLIERARRVGLEVNSALAILANSSLATGQVTPHALLRLPDVISMLRDGGRLPPGQAEAVMQWLAALAQEDSLPF